MKTVIIRPNAAPQYQKLDELRCLEPPLWAAILANRYEDPYILDAELMNLTPERIAHILKAINPGKIIILSTGSHPSAHIQQAKEGRFLKSYLEENSFTNIEHFDYLPEDPIKWGKPRWDLVPVTSYRAHNWHCWGQKNRTPYGVVYTSCGCPFSCEFCVVKRFYGTTFEQRMEQDVIADFKTYKELGVRNIKIMDELFIFNTARAESICEQVAELGGDFNIWAYARIDIMNTGLLEKMKKAGINWLAYGIESGNEGIRASISKGRFSNETIKKVIGWTKEAGINALGNYMFGFEEDTIDTMKETLELALELKCEYSNFYCLTPYPGTPQYENMEESRKLLYDYSQYSPNFLPLDTKYLSGKQIRNFRDTAFTKYFTNKDYLKMMLIKFGSEVVQEIGAMTKIKLERK